MLLLLGSCTSDPHPGYRDLGKGTYLRLLALGDGERVPSDSDRITLALRIGPVNSGAGSVFSGDRGLVLSDIAGTGLGNAVAQLHMGDSASILGLCRDLPWSGLDLTHLRPVSDTLLIDVHIRVCSIRDPAQVRAEESRFQGWKADQEADERRVLLAYLGEHEIDTISYWGSGMYVQVADSGVGPHARSGDAVTVAYVGRFLDGRVFDDNHGPDGPLHFRLGDPDQVIRGLEMGLYALGKGGRGTLIVPSALAFGHKGSALGIVPPFTTVVYEIELLDLEHSPQVGN